MLVGEIDVQPVLDGAGSIPASDIFSRPGFDRANVDFELNRDFFASDGMWEFPIGGYLIRTHDAVVVIDTGLGPVDIGFMAGGDYLDNLLAYGVQPEDVTDVLFTHLHPDHTGWAVRDGRLTFPNATYRCHAADWTHYIEDPATQHSGGIGEQLSPFREDFLLFERDGPVLSGIEAQHAPGHTPGSTMFLLTSGTDQCLFVGDVATSPMVLLEPGWSFGSDADGDLAMATRAGLIERLDADDLVIAISHAPGLRFGRIVREADQRRWQVVD